MVVNLEELGEGRKPKLNRKIKSVQGEELQRKNGYEDCTHLEELRSRMPRKTTFTSPPDMELFNSQSIQTSITGEQVLEIYPLNPITNDQPIQFDVPSTHTQLTDPNFLLLIDAKITQDDGSNLPNDSDVAPTNLFLHSIFKDIILKVNDTVVSQATGAYGYRAFIETNYTFSTAAKEGAIGIPQLYYQEPAGLFNSLDVTKNLSYAKRKAKASNSNTIKMCGRMHCDFLMQQKLIIPGIKFSVTLTRAPNSFALISSTENKAIKITKAILKIRRINITPNVLLSIEKGLQSKPAKYPVSRASVRTAQLLPGQTQLTNFVVYNGQLPRMAIVTTVASFAFEGKFSHNPYNFSWEDCIYASMDANGQSYPSAPYVPKESHMEPYLNALKAVNKLYSDTSTGITLDDFQLEGHQILTFDLSPDDSGTACHFNPKQNGVLSLTLKWGPTDLTHATTLIIYLIWDNTILIDSRRNVILDYIP